MAEADKIEWTAEQEKAIAFKGGGAIVSAAAGSGKTAVLIERVMRLILDEENPVNADEIVISTFTQKAAAELKARLSRALTAALNKNPHSVFLREQLLRLNDASICTISSFCLGIIKKHSTMLNLSPDFTILDEADSRLIFSASLERIMEDFCEKGKAEERELLFDWYGGEDDSGITELVAIIYNFSRNLTYPERFYKKWLTAYKNPDKFPKRIITEYFGSNILKPAAELKELTREFYENSAGTPAEGFSAELLRLAYLLDGITVENISDKLENASGEGIPPVPRKNAKSGFDNALCKEYKELFSEYWENILYHGHLFSRHKADMETCYPVLKILVKLVKALGKEYSERKAKINKLDFSDIEIMTLRLLRDENGEPSAAAREIAEKTSEIIVDEFQDSNDIQYEIFRLISKNKSNLYFVGDIKQSIYRFRGANPLVFQKLTKDLDFTVINLNCNFRSNDKVISAVNAIFTGTMTERLGDVDYDKKCALVQGNLGYRSTEENDTELITVMGGNMEDAREKEAQYIADRILGMIESGFEVTDRTGKRPCRYGDFAVLMGKYSANIHIYKKAFDRLGIPYEAKEESGYTDFSEVKAALSLLKIIDNPYKDKELAEVMMRPPYMYTADEMAAIKLSGGKRHKNLYSGLLSEAERDEKCAEFLSELKALRDYAGENTVENLVRKIYDESSFTAAIQASPDGRKRDENLKLLIHYSSVFSESRSGSLYDFIRFMENIDRNEVKLARPQDESAGDHRIRIMTIHGSKGLEFPICFVANLSNIYVNRDNSNLCCDPVRGIGMRISDRENMLRIDTLTYDLASEENKRLEKSEEMRLLYVAATRAREKLIFTAPRAESDKNEDMHYKWVLSCARKRGDIIKRERIEGYTAEKRKRIIGKSDKKTVIEPFSPYSHLPFTLIPAKVTATQIGVKSVDDFSKNSDKISRYLRLPSFLKEETKGKLSGKKKGDAYHKAMELLDFSGSARQLDDLLIKGKLTDIERFSIEDGEIEAFLKSDLCRRAVESGDIRREFPIFCEYDPKLWGDFGTDWTEAEERPFIQGIADMFFVEKGEIVLVDYKTNVNTTPEEFIEEYKGQLYIYKKALEEMTGMRVKECILYSFTLGLSIPVPEENQLS